MDQEKMKEYAQQAKETWGHTDAYKEYEEKNYTVEQESIFRSDMLDIMSEFGKMIDKDPADPAVQNQVKVLQDYISKQFYTCTNEILAGLGHMYTSNDFRKNIDAAAGRGTAEFVSKAIKIFTA
ncbi:MAG: TipAS antibiotic-recognition domain-containing protein [Clostridia bacterium]|nr:TipAS antibiotic-recognition domain-containing protein [Clostridia bacterium]